MPKFRQFAQLAQNRTIRSAAPILNLRTVITKLQAEFPNAIRMKKEGVISIFDGTTSYAVGVIDGYIDVSVASRDKETTIAGMETVKSLFNQKHLTRVIPRREAALFGGKTVAGLWVAYIILVTPNIPLRVLSEDMYNGLSEKLKSQWKGYTFQMSYETWDDDALDAGETDDKGWEYESMDSTYDYLEELCNDTDIRQKSWLGWSSSSPSSRDWLVSQEEENYSNGNTTTYHLWIERVDKKPLSKQEITFINQMLL